MRIGHGFDVHAFAEPGAGGADGIVLGGVSIPHTRSLLAHSDGDVALHALCDAILGALALGDIGVHFPDTDAANAGIDSRELLRRCAQLMSERGYRLGNADITVIAQEPRLASHVPAMRRCIAADLKAPDSDVSVKATTTERLGYVGRGEGIAVHAVVLLCAL